MDNRLPDLLSCGYKLRCGGWTCAAGRCRTRITCSCRFTRIVQFATNRADAWFERYKPLHHPLIGLRSHIAAQHSGTTFHRDLNATGARDRRGYSGQATLNLS